MAWRVVAVILEKVPRSGGGGEFLLIPFLVVLAVIALPLAIIMGAKEWLDDEVLRASRAEQVKMDKASLRALREYRAVCGPAAPEPAAQRTLAGGNISPWSEPSTGVVQTDRTLVAVQREVEVRAGVPFRFALSDDCDAADIVGVHVASKPSPTLGSGSQWRIKLAHAANFWSTDDWDWQFVGVAPRGHGFLSKSDATHVLVTPITWPTCNDGRVSALVPALASEPSGCIAQGVRVSGPETSFPATPGRGVDAEPGMAGRWSGSMSEQTTAGSKSYSMLVVLSDDPLRPGMLSGRVQYGISCGTTLQFQEWRSGAAVFREVPLHGACAPGTTTLRLVRDRLEVTFEGQGSDATALLDRVTGGAGVPDLERRPRPTGER